MRRIMGILTVVLALGVGIVPLFTDCLSQGASLTTTTGMIVPMKCHWTAIAEMVLAVPLGIVGFINIFSKQRETALSLGALGAVLGGLVILLPTVIVGVCKNPAHTCRLVMLPTLVLAGILIIAASAVTIIISFRRITPQAS